MSRSGADLALLLLGGYRTLVDAVVVELAARGHPDVRPVHDFAMRAIESGAENASELGRRLSVSKQAAAKTIAVLVERGYVARDADPADARRKRIQVTPRGFEVMRQGEAVFDELRARWAQRLGEQELAAIESGLTALVGDSPVRIDAPGWVAHDRD
ncbi:MULTISPECIES: MarR family winged helix-turn-helix transcriptional regulator [unclassified Modestobacter]|uniref:MarR family winged helix-turn-helix transcriptional regulator n=1 Tax=unclassified Modestobacter TaxID=2643866 RepID=UPI0022AA5DB0|nr:MULTISPECIES: MarR family transcriptional regulator [unclassified Modestobacter]MCZ2823045.1 winged helix DNA-binding protein [Modestobacter sp. VKM Ac-2981]MCZ2851291.1 winged helix DNA-binding protein [Modestobacter sp. VKM Ac-2982]